MRQKDDSGCVLRPVEQENRHRRRFEVLRPLLFFLRLGATRAAFVFFRFRGGALTLRAGLRLRRGAGDISSSAASSKIPIWDPVAATLSALATSLIASSRPPTSVVRFFLFAMFRRPVG